MFSQRDFGLCRYKVRFDLSMVNARPFGQIDNPEEVLDMLERLETANANGDVSNTEIANEMLRPYGNWLPAMEPVAQRGLQTTN